MKTSESIANLAAALCNVQASIEPARFNAVNPYFKSKYADLGAVYEACRHLMADNGLSLVQFPSVPPVESGPAVALTSRLMHQSGEWMEDTLIIPLSKATAQDYGSGLTYARRYALSAIIGIVSDEDDDANQVQPERKPAKPKVQPVTSLAHDFTVGTAVTVKGKHDEKPGTVRGYAGELVTVEVGGKLYDLSVDKLTAVQEPLFEE